MEIKTTSNPLFEREQRVWYDNFLPGEKMEGGRNDNLKQIILLELQMEINTMQGW